MAIEFPVELVPEMTEVSLASIVPLPFELSVLLLLPELLELLLLLLLMLLFELLLPPPADDPELLLPKFVPLLPTLILCRLTSRNELEDAT